MQTPTPAQQAFYPRYARWCLDSIDREILADYPLLRAFAASQRPAEPAPRFIRALLDAGPDRAALLWRADKLVSLSRWGLSEQHAHPTEAVVRLQQELEALVQRPPSSYGPFKPSPARARTTFMKRLGGVMSELTGTALDRLGGGEWQCVAQRLVSV